MSVIRVPSPGAIKRARLAAGFRKEEVAVHLGVAFKTVEAWEAGRNEPKLSNIKGMARLFGVEEDDLHEDWEDAG